MKLQRLKELAATAFNAQLAHECHETGGLALPMIDAYKNLQKEMDAETILRLIESYEELLAAAKGYLDNSVRDIGRQGRQAHGALLQATPNRRG